MTSYVENETEVQFDFDIKEISDLVMIQILDQEKCPYEAQVNLLVTVDVYITLTNNEEIHKINKEYREVDRPTDVLSFPMLSFETEADFSVAEEQEADCFDPESGELILGDIIISVDKVKEQAQKFGHSEKREFAFLVAHSMLHLCGYDHMIQEEAEVMERKQEEALLLLGITRA